MNSPKRKRRIRTAATMLAITLLFASGCRRDPTKDSGIVSVSFPEQKEERISVPQTKPDRRKWRLAYMDEDPYQETFKSVYYIIDGLKELGWLRCGELPFDPETDEDTLEMILWLCENAESEYMEFVGTAVYYTHNDPEMTEAQRKEKIRESLAEQIAANEIDAIFTMGTIPAQWAKSFGFDLPLLMGGAVDPIGSGLIASADDSGDERLWAHVDSSAYAWQMKYYYDQLHFSRIGTVYDDEIIAGIPHYRKAAEENQFKLIEYRLEKNRYPEDIYYEKLRSLYRKMISEDRVDAYLLTANVFSGSSQKSEQLLQEFADARIPVVAQFGDRYVKSGAAIMIIDLENSKEQGWFIANTIGRVFNGETPRSLPQEYISSPYLMLNFSTAEQIGFQPSFQTLVACEEIYGCE